MNIDLSGKTALVTGSTAGIGFAIAKGLAAAGAIVVLNGRDESRTQAAVTKLKREVEDADARGVARDVGTEAGCDAIVSALPAVDILVNNAGIFGPQDFSETLDEEWERFFRVNGRGFGSKLNERIMSAFLNGVATMEFEVEGLRCRIEAPLED